MGKTVILTEEEFKRVQEYTKPTKYAFNVQNQLKTQFKPTQNWLQHSTKYSRKSNPKRQRKPRNPSWKRRSPLNKRRLLKNPKKPNSQHNPNNPTRAEPYMDTIISE